jgi:phosphoglycolate phosphatase-like HAD superfamily hydrolase
MQSNSQTPLVVYVDVDDTLIRTAGTKRIPVSGVAKHIASLHADGAELYCWSSGGADYAREVATELRIEHYFKAFLPKPHVLLDDQDVSKWRRLAQIHPGRCNVFTVQAYWESINNRHLA